MNTDTPNPLLLVLKHVDYFYHKTLLDLRIKYKKTLLGIGWVLVTPLFFLALYASVHMVIYDVQPQNVSALQFVTMMFCGLMCVFGFAESLSSSSNAFASNQALMLNSHMTPEVLVAQTSLFGFINCLMGICIACVVIFLSGYATPYMMLVPVILFAQMLFTIGLGWIFSILTLLIKDLQFMIRFLTLALIIISPIAYTQDMVPPKMALLVYLNPVSYFIIPYQEILILGRMPSIDIICSMLALSGLTFIIGYRFFTRMRNTIVDYV
ncbi:MAG: ABC transporter permease [Rickettsiales bacterium]